LGGFGAWHSSMDLGLSMPAIAQMQPLAAVADCARGQIFATQQVADLFYASKLLKT